MQVHGRQRLHTEVGCVRVIRRPFGCLKHWWPAGEMHEHHLGRCSLALQASTGNGMGSESCILPPAYFGPSGKPTSAPR